MNRRFFLSRLARMIGLVPLSRIRFLEFGKPSPVNAWRKSSWRLPPGNWICRSIECDPIGDGIYRVTCGYEWAAR